MINTKSIADRYCTEYCWRWLYCLLRSLLLIVTAPPIADNNSTTYCCYTAYCWSLRHRLLLILTILIIADSRYTGYCWSLLHRLLLILTVWLIAATQPIADSYFTVHFFMILYWNLLKFSQPIADSNCTDNFWRFLATECFQLFYNLLLKAIALSVADNYCA